MIKIELSEIGVEDRVFPRLVDYRQSDYEVQFDSKTFCYDVFSKDGRTFLICPPHSDDAWTIALNSIIVNGLPISKHKYSLYKNKVHKLIIEEHAFTLAFGDRFIEMEKVSSFPNKRARVLYTLQKDNNLSWIKSWIDWHIANHEIDTVIIYDNLSLAYGLNQISDFLSECNAEIIVHSCPYKYGPGAFKGSPWDSDYLQYAMFEHVRYYYCNSDSMFINADIDELVICRNNRSVFDLVLTSNTVSHYRGVWVEVSEDVRLLRGNDICHADHNLINRDNVCPNKWTANLKDMPDATFLRVHDHYGKGTIKIATDDALYIHHRCINTNWKYKRVAVNEHGGAYQVRTFEMKDFFD